MSNTAQIAVVMGSKSDWATMQEATQILDELKVPYHVEVVSAHRTPDKLFEFAENAQKNGYKVIIMKIIDILKFNRELIKRLRAAGIRLKDERYIDLYNDYTELRRHGEKVSYIVLVLSTRYAVSERTVYSLIKRMNRECNIFAV